jgi:hypothetical protein
MPMSDVMVRLNNWLHSAARPGDAPPFDFGPLIVRVVGEHKGVKDEGHPGQIDNQSMDIQCLSDLAHVDHPALN